MPPKPAKKGGASKKPAGKGGAKGGGKGGGKGGAKGASKKGGASKKPGGAGGGPPKPGGGGAGASAGGGSSAEGAGGGANVTLINNKTIYTEHELELEGKTLKEIKEFSDQNAGGQSFRTVFIHTRSIGDVVLQKIETHSAGTLIALSTNTTLTEGEIPAFESQWRASWKPQINYADLKQYEKGSMAAAAISGPDDVLAGKEIK